MQKILFYSLICGTILSANSTISAEAGIKNYANSKTKTDGTTYAVEASHKYKNSLIHLSYTKDSVDRENKIRNIPIDTLNVEKYSLNYKHILTEKLRLKASYLKIIDNLAPTDQGKIYGIGTIYSLQKGLQATLDYYRSDYKQFDVHQYDFSLSKKFQFKGLKVGTKLMTKYIDIDGEKYGSYRFKDTDYFTTGVQIGANYNNYVAGVGALFGKRMFAVLQDGHRVQHHAMEQDKTYMFSLGKKFQNFDIIARYVYQNGNELPEKQNDVDTKVSSLRLTYKF